MRQTLTSALGKRRWDSSDPERAPPPLPLNPSTSSPTTRPNTSARIEEAAALITAKAREHAQGYVSSKATPTGSPEKSLIKNHHHKRMQSMQNGNVRDMSTSLERRSPEKALDRQDSTRTPRKSDFEATPERKSTPTPMSPSGRESPTRSYLNRPILGENTPPSATMLALQNMRSRSEQEMPLSNITNQNTTVARAGQTYDGLSSQLLSLTSICTNLQREMTQLSRRSKDNATDLVSLKEATNSRDEDIRKSLKELSFTISEKYLYPETPRIKSEHGSYFLDAKPHSDSGKSFSLPRIPSPNSFAASMDRDLAATPSLVSSDGVANVASIALLEKILREMGTKEGQTEIMSALNEARSNTSKSEWDPTFSRKLEDIMKFMKENSSSQALVRVPPGTTGGTNRVSSSADIFNSTRTGQISRAAREMTPQDDRRASAGPVAPIQDNEELMALLKRIKGSIAEGGGLTNEVKALVRELRGEVLGMGREIARKLEKSEKFSSDHQAASTENPSISREEIAQIVESGLSQLGQQMERTIYEQRRQSSGTTKSAVDPQEVYHVVRSAIADQMPLQHTPEDSSSRLEKEEILTAVREAWEDCKPEIELQNFGLERDEILECLKEGLKSYQPESSIREAGASYDDVLDAVQKGLSAFQPPPIETPASITREEILMSVRECLETFDFPGSQISSAARDIASREEIIEAVREGMQSQDPVSKEIEFNRDDLFDAIRAALADAPTLASGEGAQVLEQMNEFIGSMKTEFKQYSAANGRDTEQVLDAMKDGLEELRADIESYVDRASDVTGKDEIIDSLKAGFASLQSDMDKGFANVPQAQARTVDTPELLDAMEKEFNYLRETLSKSIMQSQAGGSSSDKSEILDAIRDMSEVNDRGSSLTVDTTNVASMVKEELEHLRETLAGMLVRQTATLEREDILDAVREGLTARKMDGAESVLSNTSELLDAFQDGVDGLRADMQKLAENNKSVDIGSTGLESALEDLKEGLENVRNDIDKLHSSNRQIMEVPSPNEKDQEIIASDSNLISTEIEGLKVMITQLRIKVEALDNMPPPAPEIPPNLATKDDLEDLASTLREVQVSFADIGTKEPSSSANAATKEDTDAIETLLRNAKAQLDELDPEKIAKFEHIEALDDVLVKVKETIDVHRESSASKEDFEIVESLLRDLSTGMEELQGKLGALPSEEERVTKADIQAVETLCFDTKAQIEELNLPDPEIFLTKTDMETLQEKLASLQEQIEADNELTAQAFDARKTEHGGLATKIDDAQALLSELRDELMKKLDGSEEGIVELAKTLEGHNETFGTLATAATLGELGDMIKEHFEKSTGAHDATKLEVEERDAALLVKHEETKAALTKEIGDKLEEKFTELMLKYDDAQQASETSRTAQTEATTSTRTVVDDLKTLLDTLGTTLTETCEKMTNDAKTVFDRVDATHGKVEEIQTSSLTEHNATREEIAKTISAAEKLQLQLDSHHPEVLNAIKEIANIVSQHYEHSQKSSEEVKSHISSIPSAIPPLLPAPPTSPELPQIEIPVPEKYDDSHIVEKLNTLMEHPAPEKYDDSHVVEKLNELIEQAASAQESLNQMEKLDGIHQQVLATAGEISAMVTTQARLMSEHHENKAQEAQEAAIALEKRNAQKEAVEAEIVRLSQEKAELAESVAALRKEHEELSGQSKRLTREVGVLETALSMRREEMQIMERRAETLEKKVLEGVMDHARALMMSRPATNISSKRKRREQRDQAMNLKRVPSAATTASKASTIKDPASSAANQSTVSSAVGMALKRRAPLQEGGNSRPASPYNSLSGKERRILSTSNVTPRSSLHADSRALMLAPVAVSPSTGGLMNLKRSHSVKSNPSSYYGGRKVSWAASTTSGMNNKENQLVVHEEDEGDQGHQHDDIDVTKDDTASLADTDRRTSYTGTANESDLYTVTDSMAYGTGSEMSTSTSGSRSVSQVSSTVGALEGDRGEGGLYVGAESDETETQPTNDDDSDSLDDDGTETDGGSVVSHHEHDEDEELADHHSQTHEQNEETEDQILALLGPPSSQSTSTSLTNDDQETPVDGSDDKQLTLNTGAESETSVAADNDNAAATTAGTTDPATKEMIMYQYNQPSDSGIGSELPTAALERMGGDYPGYFSGGEGR